MSAMTPERFQQIEELYYAAREGTAEQRAVLLAETDPELRREVELLPRNLRAATSWPGLLSRIPPNCCWRMRLSPYWPAANGSPGFRKWETRPFQKREDIHR
jgi:hypothetical protein